MKDLWTELARRVRAAEGASVEEMPFGFEDAVLRRWKSASSVNPLDSWIPLLRPALGLAFSAAAICLALQFQADQPSMPDNILTQTEEMIQFVVLR